MRTYLAFGDMHAPPPRARRRYWNAFVEHANVCHKDRYVCAFVEQPLECVGPLDGTGCPHVFRVDLGSSESPSMLAHMHPDSTSTAIPRKCVERAVWLSVVVGRRDSLAVAS